jgi:hypothetical protein
MMYVEFDPINPVHSLPGLQRFEWHVGEVFPRVTVFPRDFITIQADGDELQYILSTFQGIPKTTARVVVWTGDFARFIYDNLHI